jgi:hypothetical protein
MTSESLESRMQRMEDIEEIKQLQIRYVNYLITGKWDELLDLFDEDGAVELGPNGLHKGRAALEKEYKERVARGHNGHEGDFVVHPLISIDGDKAKGSWLLYLQKQFPYKLDNGRDQDWAQAFYDMEYIKKNGKWKISLLKVNTRIWSPRPPYIQVKENNS